MNDRTKASKYEQMRKSKLFNYSVFTNYVFHTDTNERLGRPGSGDWHKQVGTCTDEFGQVGTSKHVGTSRLPHVVENSRPMRAGHQEVNMNKGGQVQTNAGEQQW